MKRKVAMVSLLIIISGMAILLWGCPPPPEVRTRPPEPRIEAPGLSPYPEAHWIPGHWEHRRGDWVWIPGHWGRPPRHGAVWVPGHWSPRGDGWAWTPGRWEYR
jgi:hypothetical protein